YSPASTTIPITSPLPTLFRSHPHEHSYDHSHHHDDCSCGEEHQHEHEHAENESAGIKVADIFIATAAVADYRTLEAAPQKIKKRSEEHTSELQSRFDLVGRLL